MYRYVKNNPLIYTDWNGFRFVGPPCSGCLGAYTHCALGVTGAYAACMGWEANPAVTITCAGVCALLAKYNLVSGSYCYVTCALYGAISLITSGYICAELSQRMTHECGNKYNQCTYRDSSCCGNPSDWGKCGKPSECENWRPD